MHEVSAVYHGILVFALSRTVLVCAAYGVMWRRVINNKYGPDMKICTERNANVLGETSLQGRIWLTLLNYWLNIVNHFKWKTQVRKKLFHFLFIFILYNLRKCCQIFEYVTCYIHETVMLIYQNGLPRIK